MTTTIFLHDARTLRVSFPYSKESVEAIKQIGGARWNPESRTWRVPLERLDALLAVFGDDVALAPEVVLAAEAEQQEVIEPRRPATPEQRLLWFLDTLVWAGVALRLEGPRVIGSGGCWTPMLQAEIDQRADGLRALIEGGWQPKPATPAPVAVQPTTLDRITRMDHVLAAGERNAQANEARKAALVERQRAAWRQGKEREIDAQLGLEGLP